jgi:uncharacterized protein YecE (DUF72 family)
LPDDFIVTADIVHIRLHGAKKMYRDDYSKDELKGWASKIKSVECKEIYCYFNNDFVQKIF